MIPAPPHPPALPRVIPPTKGRSPPPHRLYQSADMAKQRIGSSGSQLAPIPSRQVSLPSISLCRGIIAVTAWAAILCASKPKENRVAQDSRPARLAVLLVTVTYMSSHQGTECINVGYRIPTVATRPRGASWQNLKSGWSSYPTHACPPIEGHSTPASPSYPHPAMLHPGSWAGHRPCQK